MLQTVLQFEPSAFFGSFVLKGIVHPKKMEILVCFIHHSPSLLSKPRYA